MSDGDIDDIEIFGMSGSAARNWLRSDGAGLFFAYPVGSDLLGYLRENGVIIPTSTFYDIRSQVLSANELQLQMSQLSPYDLIPMAYHNQDHGLTLSAEYEYRVHVYGLDPETGAIKSQWMTVASDRQLDKNTIQETARMFIGEGGESGNILLDNFGELEAMRRVQ
jgi:hypothetical protein